ncbi:MAG: YCF48-related protein, partial [candidate division WOR-3 bacterium]|nr:YCF48-related protein [candidate division WOR-3 bacterium]
WNDDFNPRYIDFPVNASVGYMSGGYERGTTWYGCLYKTTDGGATWDTVLVDTSMSMNDMTFPETDQVGYVIGSNKAYKTTDGGNSWRKLEFGQDTILLFCHFVDNRLGFITGIHNIELCLPYDPGFVMKTTDGLIGIKEEPVDVRLSNLQVLTPIGREAVLYYSNCPGGLHAQVFDVSGRKVDEMHAAGSSGTIIWGATHSPGVYFIRSSSGSATAGKVILIE